MTEPNREVLAQLIESSAEPIIVARIDHPDWPVVLSNSAFGSMTDYVPVVSKPLADVVENLVGRELALEISETIRGGHHDRDHGDNHQFDDRPPRRHRARELAETEQDENRDQGGADKVTDASRQEHRETRRHDLDGAAQYPAGDDDKRGAERHAADFALAGDQSHAQQKVTDGAETEEDRHDDHQVHSKRIQDPNSGICVILSGASH